MATNGIYIHVPFCGSRCIYCDFFSTTMLGRREEYVKALCLELKQRKTEAQVPTIYLGGGTPSILAPEQLKIILECVMANYNVLPDAEITLEANPDDVSEELLRNLPINRLSMGVQSMNDDRLKFLRRRHTAQQAIEAIATARKCGIENISIDLIYSLPGQTMDEWRHDVQEALALPITHLSAYALSYEEGTALYKMREQGNVEEVSEDISREMYYFLLDAIQDRGFTHYEISNFALPGYKSRHNSSYWVGTPYLGFGPGAHSYDGEALRRSNLTDIDCWIKGLYEEERLTENDCFNEFVFLSLRTSRGMNVTEMKRRFPFQSQQIEDTLMRLIYKGLLVREGDVVRLAREAIFTSDDIISDLFI